MLGQKRKKGSVMNTIQYERKNFEAVSPYVARFGNFFFCFDRVCTFDFYGKTIHIRPFADKKFEHCDFILALKAGTSIWNFAFQHEDILLFNPAIKNAEDIKQSFTSLFPLEVKQALLEALFAPFIEKCSQKLGIKIAVENIEFIEKDFSFPAYLAFAFEETNAQTNENAYENIFYVQIPEEPQSLQILEKLAQIIVPEKKNKQAFSAVEIPLAFCLGQTELTVQDLQNVTCGDYILCDEYYPKNAQLRLYPCCFGQSEALAAQDYLLGNLNGKTIEIVEWVHACKKEDMQAAPNAETQNKSDEGKAMDESKANVSAETENVSQNSAQISLENIPVTVQFSLAERMINLQELQQINAGYVFALENDFLAPVTLLVNGKSIGKGKIVDINGTVAVQVVEINK